jgi:hypothetical protein
MDLKPLKDVDSGDLAELGREEFHLDNEGQLVKRRVMIQENKEKIGGLLETRNKLKAQLEQIETLIQTYNELSEEK